jgi:hypothetical protein
MLDRTTELDCQVAQSLACEFQSARRYREGEVHVASASVTEPLLARRP